MSKLLTNFREILTNPTAKQSEAHGRLCHNFCAASAVAFMAMLFNGDPYDFKKLSLLAALLMASVVFFYYGSLFSKGE